MYDFTIASNVRSKVAVLRECSPILWPVYWMAMPTQCNVLHGSTAAACACLTACTTRACWLLPSPWASKFTWMFNNEATMLRTGSVWHGMAFECFTRSIHTKPAASARAEPSPSSSVKLTSSLISRVRLSITLVARKPVLMIDLASFTTVGFAGALRHIDSSLKEKMHGAKPPWTPLTSPRGAYNSVACSCASASSPPKAASITFAWSARKRSLLSVPMFFCAYSCMMVSIGLRSCWQDSNNLPTSSSKVRWKGCKSAVVLGVRANTRLPDMVLTRRLTWAMVLTPRRISYLGTCGAECSLESCVGRSIAQNRCA